MRASPAKFSNGQATSRPGPGPGGFTLLELVVVIVITAILSLTAAPMLSHFGTLRQHAGGARLRSDLSLARQRAVATGVRTWAVFDTGDQTLTVYEESAATPGRANRTAMAVPGEVGPGWVTRFNEGEFRGATLLTVNLGGGAEVGFDYLGRPYTQAEAVMTSDGTVTMAGGVTVTVEGETGHVH